MTLVVAGSSPVARPSVLNAMDYPPWRFSFYVLLMCKPAANFVRCWRVLTGNANSIAIVVSAPIGQGSKPHNLPDIPTSSVVNT